MKTNYLISVAALMLAAILTFYSCDKEAFLPDSQTASDNSRAEGATMDAFNFTNTGGGGKDFSEDVCFTINRVVTDSNVVVTVTFPDEGCILGNDGVTRKGKIIIKHKGILNNIFGIGNRITVTFDNYSRNGEILTGTLTAVLGTPTGLEKFYTITATNMKLESIDGKTITWNSTRTIKWISGFLTLNRNDDHIIMSGETQGVNKNGESFVSVFSNLTKIADCPYISSGTVTITKGSNVLEVNYGNGACDKSFTVTQNGQTITINP